MEFKHISVLLNECIDGLNINPDGIYVDGTMGGGGHSLEIVKRLKNGKLYCFDRDTEAIKAASERLSDYKKNFEAIHDNYGNMKAALLERGVDKVDGILLDLGVSSYQLDNSERGFSYMDEDAPLDMRMDQTQELSAETIINEYSKEELVRILREYGEEKFAARIAENILKERASYRLTTTGQLVSIIKHSIPMKAQVAGGHPAKRTFQAIRIECNKELTVLREHMDDFIDLLNRDGRLCIITFHSLEDRIVKNAMKTAERPCTCPPNFPVCVCGKVSKGKVITNKPILPSVEELEYNSRSKSAKLRIFERHI